MLFLRKLILFILKNFLGTNVYWDVPAFLFFGHKDVSDFLEFHLKLFFFFYYPFYSKISGPFIFGGLRQWPNWPSGRVDLAYRFNTFTIPMSMDGEFWLFGKKNGRYHQAIFFSSSNLPFLLNHQSRPSI